jgi:hypothetical protein
MSVAGSACEEAVIRGGVRLGLAAIPRPVTMKYRDLCGTSRRGSWYALIDKE